MNVRELIFTIVGAIGGAVGAHLALKDAYDKKMNEEIAQIHKYYMDKYATDEEKENPIKNAMNPPVNHEESEEPDYEDIIEKLNYNAFSTTPKVDIPEKPYIITQEEYDTNNKYDKKLMSFFPDDEVLMDSETEEVVEDAGRAVGFDNLGELGEAREIFVRNEEMGIDYDIVLEMGAYGDMFEDS